MLKNKAIQFIVLFLISYLILNGLYQLVMHLSHKEPDVFTYITINSFCIIFSDFSYFPSITQIGYVLLYQQQKIINITEGCNAIAIVITLLSFCLAYKSNWKNYLLFLPIAIVFVFITNLLRIYWLVYIKINHVHFFHFFHVYIFPAILYASTFGLLVLWVKIFSNKKTT